MTLGSPKPLVDICGQPILEIILRRLSACGVGRATICLTPLAAEIRDRFGNGTKVGCKLSYSVAEEFLGTAGPLALVAPIDQPTVVMNADILTDLDFRELLRFHERNGAAATVTVCRYRQFVPFGTITCDGEDRVSKIQEKPSFDFLVSAGIYVLDTTMYRYLEGAYLDMPDLLRKMVDAGERVMAFRFDGAWHDIGTPSQLDSTRRAFLSDPRRYLPEPLDVPEVRS